VAGSHNQISPPAAPAATLRMRWLRLYYGIKYRAFRRERHVDDGRRGLVALQIDALAYADLRRAIEMGYCPTISGLIREEGYALRRWFCGLPSATPYVQAGLFHGQNAGIPAFRFYDKKERRVITCNEPAGVQYIRDRLHAPGALAGGSSYVNLLDGDAQTVAFTVATRERMSVFQRLGGWRMATLILVHPIRMLRMGGQAMLEWLREEWERAAGELARKRTHSEGLFPFIRILSNVVVRELQTMAILLDVYLGVPVIYSTFMQYDELGHHFGPSSWQALRDLRRTDARIREIRRMMGAMGGRAYDLVILSDHGMTPAASYRVRFGETLGTTVQRMLEESAGAVPPGSAPLRARESYARSSEYADMGAQAVETVALAAPASQRAMRRFLLRLRDWLRSRYGLRGLVIPEKYRVEEAHAVVVTYSSCLALLYFADRPERVELQSIVGGGQRGHLYAALLGHPGVGLLATRDGPSVHLESRSGRAIVADGTLEIIAGRNPLEAYDGSATVVRAVEHLVSQPNAGDIVIFGAYDGYEIVSFDDQIGAHGAAGGNQLHPFVIAPAELQLEHEKIEDARDMHRVLMLRYARVATALMLACVPAALHAQRAVPRDTMGVIAGRLLDSASHAPIFAATVALPETRRGAIVDSGGRFVLDGIAPGLHTLRARRFGYKDVERDVIVGRGDTVHVEIFLAPTAAVLGAVRTLARPVERDAFDARPNVGAVSLSARAASSVPRFGDPDIIRVVQLLPGVEARNDFSTGLNVRGGESDQNLIMIDGFPIYNPFHLGGLFSTFIDPTVRDVTLLTGGFPARYGGRLSSVLDVRSAEEPRTGVHGSAEVSVLASTGSIGGSSSDGRATWMIAGRRTYADKFVGLVSDNSLPYHFRDEQAHFTYDFKRRTRLLVTAYDGDDRLDADLAQFGESNGEGTGGGRFKFSWGNRVVGAALTHSTGRWAHGDSIVAEQRFSHSRFATVLDLGDGSLTLDNSVADRRLNGSLTSYGSAHDRSLGYDVTAYRIDYLAESTLADARFYELSQRPTAAGVYYDDLWRASPSLLLEGGVRLESITGSRWTGVSPRVSAKYFLARDLALTGAIGRYAQWTHSLAREDVPVRLFDFWVASDSTTPVSTAWHYILGAERWMGTHRYARVEGFYKRYAQLLESNPQEDPSRVGDEFFSADGTSYGVDVLLRQFEGGEGPFSGWLSYTYAVSSRERNGVTYFPGHDRRHNLNLVGTWRIRRYVLGARYGFATGTPYTPIIGEISRRIYDPGRNAYGTAGVGSNIEFIGGLRNSARLPWTQRLDVSATREYSWHHASIAPYLSVVNAGNAKNVFIYVFDYSQSPPTRGAISQFPLLPSAGVSIRF
jgi:Type I phosphodiesterase / nucleotide pyrophosphatase/Carboxypeptidase regulatory-like domain/TonB-dependent Receptor Plug Domain